MEACYNKMDNQTAIVSPKFCVPNSVRLTVARKKRFMVVDDKGNCLFNVKEKPLCIHGHHVLLNSKKNPIVIIKKKILSVHKRWHVLRGDGSCDLLFTARSSTLVPFKIKLDVFLADDHKEENSWDLRLLGAGCRGNVLCTVRTPYPLQK